MNYSHRCIPGLFWLLAVTAFLFSFTSTSRAAEANTLVIVSHPYPEQSVMTKGLEAAAQSVPGVTVRNLEALYGFDTRNINADEERRLMRTLAHRFYLPDPLVQHHSDDEGLAERYLGQRRAGSMAGQRDADCHDGRRR